MSEQIADEAKQYLTFKLQEETYAINISQVKEVVELLKITRVPRSPKFMLGVINLRGSVLPVINLHNKFSLADFNQSVDSSIIIVETAIEEEPVIIGSIVDAVQEVIELSEENIEEAPKIGTHLNTDFISGIGKKNDDFIIILDVEKVFSREELMDNKRREQI